MIDFDWYLPGGAGFSDDVESQLRQMLAEAAEADAEAGFPQLSVDDSVEAGTSHLLVWLLPDERQSSHDGSLGPSLAAYLRVEPLEGEDAGVGEVSYVVRPEYRSRGITTLLLEKIRLDTGAPDGWCGTGVGSLRSWARANHPAAWRIALRLRRYGVRTALRRWQLVVPLRVGREIDPDAAAGPQVRNVSSPADRAAAAELWTASGRRRPPPTQADLLVTGPDGEPDGAVWVDLDAKEPTEWGPAGRLLAVLIRDDDPERLEDPLKRALLVAGLERLRDAGIGAGLITVDAQDRPLVHEARTLGLVHDQTDVQYTVGGALAADAATTNRGAVE